MFYFCSVDKPVNGLTNGLKLNAVLDKLLSVTDETEEALLCKVIPNILVPIVDCTDPFANLTALELSGQLPNCMSDCVCIHGFNSGYCQPSKIAKGGTACICSFEMPKGYGE